MSGRTHALRFRIRRDSVAAARRRVGEILIEWRLSHLVEDAVLITSELATNVVNHTKGTGDYFELALRRRDSVLVLEVSDSYQWQMPELRKATPEDLHGRGLFLVDALAESWGVRPRSTGKTVWAQLPVHTVEQP